MHLYKEVVGVKMGDYFDAIPNYTGPWISNGKFQESVEFGDKAPKDALDALSRLHDSAYKKWNDRLHRTVADSMYNEQAMMLAGVFPELARDLVLYGNHASRSWDKLSTRVSQLGPLGILVGGIENMYDLNDLVMNGSEVEKEIIAYYATDPFPEFQLGRSKKMGNTDTKYASDWDPVTGKWLDPKREGGSKYDPGKEKKKPPIDPYVGGSVLDDVTVGGATGTYTQSSEADGQSTESYNPQPGVNAYNSFNENVVNRKPRNDSKYKYQIGFRPFGDIGRGRPVYYHPESGKFTQIKRQRRKNKIYAFE